MTATGTTRHRGVARFVVGTVSLAMLTALATLAVWAVAYPTVRGWSPTAVVSGSMAPAIDVGDILVAAPVDEARLKPGAVVVFDDPAGGRFVTHRIVDVTDSGDLVTRGDGNAEDDSSRVRPEDVEGIGRLIIPFVGLPHSWVANGQWHRLVLAVIVIGVAIWSSRWGILDEYDPWGPGARRAPRPDTAMARMAPALASLVLAGGLAGQVAVSQANFVDPSDSPTNSITAAASFP